MSDIWEGMFVNEYELLNIATSIGKRMMECGAEIYRVEESILRMCQAYGLPQVDVFAIPTSIVVTIGTEDGRFLTRTKRVYTRGNDLDKLDQFNDLCRHICKEKMSYEQARTKADAIEHRPTYSLWGKMFAHMLASVAFCFFFGGNAQDATVSATIGAMIFFLSRTINLLEPNPFLNTLISSAVSACMAFGAVQIGWGINMDKIIIGPLMLLVPGITITNSMRDIIAGDFLTGWTKVVEAFLMAAGIALGTMVPLSLLGG